MLFMLYKRSHNRKCDMSFKKNYRRMKSRMTRKILTIHMHGWSASLNESDEANRSAI